MKLVAEIKNKAEYFVQDIWKMSENLSGCVVGTAGYRIQYNWLWIISQNNKTIIENVLFTFHSIDR